MEFAVVNKTDQWRPAKRTRATRREWKTRVMVSGWRWVRSSGSATGAAGAAKHQLTIYENPSVGNTLVAAIIFWRTPYWNWESVNWKISLPVSCSGIFHEYQLVVQNPPFNGEKEDNGQGDDDDDEEWVILWFMTWQSPWYVCCRRRVHRLSSSSWNARKWHL